MRLPSKIISYKESTLSKFPPILDVLLKQDMPVLDLYKATKKYFYGVEEYVDTLDCLFALQKIVFNEQSEVIHYVV